MPTVTAGNVTYEYFERSFGKNRGIEIGVQNADNNTSYQLRPNPHDNKKYNKNQPRFYLDLATAIAQHAQQNNGTMPADGTQFEIMDEDYTVERR